MMPSTLIIATNCFIHSPRPVNGASFSHDSANLFSRVSRTLHSLRRSIAGSAYENDDINGERKSSKSALVLAVLCTLLIYK